MLWVALLVHIECICWGYHFEHLVFRSESLMCLGYQESSISSQAWRQKQLLCSTFGDYWGSHGRFGWTWKACSLISWPQGLKSAEHWLHKQQYMLLSTNRRSCQHKIEEEGTLAVSWGQSVAGLRGYHSRFLPISIHWVSVQGPWCSRIYIRSWYSQENQSLDLAHLQTNSSIDSYLSTWKRSQNMDFSSRGAYSCSFLGP